MNPRSATGKRLFVIYFQDGYIGVAPTVLGFANELTAAGHDVHIRGLETEYPSPGHLSPSCHVATFSRLTDEPLGVKLCSWMRRMKLATLLPLIELGWFAFRNLLLDRRIPAEQRGLRRINIGVDLQGGVLAWWQSVLARSRYVWLSLELPGPPSYRRLEKLVGWLEARALGSAAALIIQDPDRLRSLSRHRSPLPLRVFYVPNSAGPPAFRSPPASSDNYLRSSNNYLRRKLGIDPERFPYIALQAGMIQEEVYPQELAKAFSRIDSGFALVFHDRHKRSEKDPYVRLLRSHNSRNLFLSLDPVPFDEVDAIFASATVGLVFYRPVDDNFAMIASASGKLSFNLKHGIPVLMNSLPSLAALNERYEFGVMVRDPQDPAELSAALKTIMSRYDFYSANARRCFQEELDFQTKFVPLREFLEAL